MEKRDLNIKSLAIGFLLAIAIILSIGAVGELNEVGRYQISSVGDTPSRAWIIDTKLAVLSRVAKSID